MKVLRKILLGVALATSAVGGTMIVAPSQAQAMTTRFLVMYGFPGSGVFPYCGADTGDRNYANAAAGVLQKGGWATIIIDVSTP